MKAINNIDAGVDQEIFTCLNPDHPRSFFLFAGAGSGKTSSLVSALKRFKDEYGIAYRLQRRKVAVITYTNAAANEITHRLQYDPIFRVSTIHSFCWELIATFTTDIKAWLRDNLESEIAELEETQSRSRDKGNKTSVERAGKIASKQKRLEGLAAIRKFIYNPNGDNLTVDSLNHVEVIKITSHFIASKPLMQDLIVAAYPILLVDESQDTNKAMLEALFELEKCKQGSFVLGLFGDMMQRIYGDGMADLGLNLPTHWSTPAKQMNHRSAKRIIRLINTIRQKSDSQQQVHRSDKAEGWVRLFIAATSHPKGQVEQAVARQMAKHTADPLWDLRSGDVMTLILEHHMAASRMEFEDLFEALYQLDDLRTALLNGTLTHLNLFARTVLPLVQAKRNNNPFLIARLIKGSSPLFDKEQLLSSKEQGAQMRLINAAVQDLLSLWDNGNDPILIDVLRKIKIHALFPLSGALEVIASRDTKSAPADAAADLSGPSGNTTSPHINAWEKALTVPFSQVENYHHYIDGHSAFGTHQGVKGLEYDRVMVIADDAKAKGFLFTYDKLFGAKDLTPTDLKNLEENKETGIDRTRRLFYVACSRARESLAIVAYSEQPEAVKSTALGQGWFGSDEIRILTEADIKAR